ncbi:conserved Plasmodium protein, unknown function [Plasmodium malariae]|uniref:RNA-editing substrate-binding complex 6 protein domain-containing protein n=1 Tax=Plasmodium malariae TaxID=5858 RepID=A0A1A8W7W7_PLAMA|nr:conserved Plasmodium protein, unknown function [Plasmodium malariae]
MRKLLKTAIVDIEKIKRNSCAKSENVFKENLRSLIIKNIDKFENEEILKIIEKYNENCYKDHTILKCSYDVFKKNIHRYSFDQINKIMKLYHGSQTYDKQFNTSIFSYIIRRLNAMPAFVSVNVFHNLIRCGLRDYNNIDIIKDHFKKNIDTYNTLDLTIILSSFALLQEEFLLVSTKSFDKENSDEVILKNSLSPRADYSDILIVILNKIRNDEIIHNNLSVINSILILNMISRTNISNYEIFKFFTKRYYKKLKEKDVEPHHLTLLLNSFAKCNININILKYIIKYMNNDNFINQLSYVNITNALHYMAKFNYKNKDFLNRLKKKVIELIDTIPQREFSNIMWSLAKLKINDHSFYFICLQKIKSIIHLMDMMSIAQVLDALRRGTHVSNEELFQNNLLQQDRCKNGTIKLNEYSGNGTKLISNMIKKVTLEQGHAFSTSDKEEKVSSKCSTPLKDQHHAGIEELLHHDPIKINTDKVSERNIDNALKNYENVERDIIHLLIQKYLANIEKCSLHVLTQVPFCCLQLNCTNYSIYHKSLEVLKRKKKYMSTLNLIYARYFIRILIEKQENNFQKLPRSVKQFAKEIMNSDNS